MPKYLNIIKINIILIKKNWRINMIIGIENLKEKLKEKEEKDN